MTFHKNKIFLAWLPLAVVASCLSFVIFGAVQQSLRQSANDPQVQLAEDIGSAFSQGQDPHQLSANNSVDMAKSLSTFLIVYDEKGQIIISSAKLNSQIPIVPKGVLDYAKSKGENIFTWEPAKGVRLASAIYYYHGANSGYVLAGKSLREVEKRIQRIFLMVAAGWLVTLAAAAAAIYWVHREPKHHHSAEY